MMWWTGRLSFDLPLGRRCYVPGSDRSGHESNHCRFVAGTVHIYLYAAGSWHLPKHSEFFVLRLTFWSGQGIRTSSCRIGCSQWPSPEAQPLASSSTAVVEEYITVSGCRRLKRSWLQIVLVHKVWHGYNSDMMLLSLSLSLLFAWQQYSGVGCSRTILYLSAQVTKEFCNSCSYNAPSNKRVHSEKRLQGWHRHRFRGWMAES